VAGLTLPPPPAAGRLELPARTFAVEGTARRAKVGVGRDALVAAAGEELIVVRFTVTPGAGGPDRGTARLDAGRNDGGRPFAQWSSLPAGGVLVVSVPAGADAVLAVTSGGRVHRLSLATGEVAVP
jgi:hypothetical protein